MRRFLRWIACVGIAWQLAAIASPLALSSDAFGIDPLTCCPGLGAGQVCPMHHKSAADAKTCKMDNPCGHHDSSLLILTAIGILPPQAVTHDAPFHIARVSAIVESPLSRAFVPDLPPPRS